MTTSKPSLDSLRIDRPEPSARKRGGLIWIVLLVLVLAAAAAAFWWWSNRTATALVTTATARQVRASQATTVLNASGYVTARRQATVSSKATGRIIEVLIEEGMSVEKGQVLARLDTSNVRTSFNLASAQLEARRAALSETEVQLEQARIDLARIERLIADEVASQADLDSARTAVDALDARLVRQREEIGVSSRQLAVFRQQLDDTVIRAPFSGVIVAKNAQPGEMISPVSAGGGFTRTGIGTLVDMESLEIEVDVNEAYINRVFADQPVEAVLDAYPDWRIPAHVIAIIPTADRQRATVKVRIGFEELDPRILPDMGVKVAFREEADTSESAGMPQVRIEVPARAVRTDGDKKIVYVVEDGVAERRAISVAADDGNVATVLSGVRDGDKVIVQGPQELTNGTPVREAKE